MYILLYYTVVCPWFSNYYPFDGNAAYSADPTQLVGMYYLRLVNFFLPLRFGKVYAHTYIRLKIC